MRVLVDTSFLMRFVELGSDLVWRVEDKVGTRLVMLLVPGVVEELERLSSGSGKKARIARLALELCKNLEMVGAPCRHDSADAMLERTAKGTGMPVVTCDHKLKRALRERGIAVIYVNRKGEVSVEGFIS